MKLCGKEAHYKQTRKTYQERLNEERANRSGRTKEYWHKKKRGKKRKCLVTYPIESCI